MLDLTFPNQPSDAENPSMELLCASRSAKDTKYSVVNMKRKILKSDLNANSEKYEGVNT